MAFTEEEFNIMVEELLYSEPISFTMLCTIAEKTLRKKINLLCLSDDCLRGRLYEDDIMQEIQIRLMKTTISNFLLKDGPDAPVNMDPDGFRAWMNTVALNIKRDFSNKVRKMDFKTVNTDDNSTEDPTSEDAEILEKKLELLRAAFSTVISADVNVYKILTWIAQFIFVIELDITKIQSNSMIVETFGKKTLFEMYDMLLKMSQQVAWIEISPSQHKKIVSSLNKCRKDGSVYGDTRYEEFFMKIDGKKSGKKSISDWVNRMNSLVQKKHGLNRINSEEDF